MRSILSQGNECAILSFKYASQDWSSWIEKCQVPIELVQGRHSPSSSLEAVEHFAMRHPNKNKLYVIPDAGSLAFFTDTDLMIEKLRAFVGLE